MRKPSAINHCQEAVALAGVSHKQVTGKSKASHKSIMVGPHSHCLFCLTSYASLLLMPMFFFHLLQVYITLVKYEWELPEKKKNKPGEDEVTEGEEKDKEER